MKHLLSQRRLVPIVNQRHRLASNLRAMWLALPGTFGKNQVQDIGGIQYPRTGTWNNVTSTTGWGSTTRRGGFGEFRFDGATSNTYVDMGTWADQSARTTTSGFTQCCWVKMTSNAGGFDTFFSKSVVGNNNDLLINPVTSTVSFYLQFSGANVLTTTSALTAGIWAHVCGTVIYDANAVISTFSLYFNGVLEATQGFSGPHTMDSGSYRLGNSTQFGGRPFNGAVDDARVYFRGLTYAEVRELVRNSTQQYPGFFVRRGLPRGLFPGTATVSPVNFRRSLSSFGTRAGSRQGL